MNTIKMKISLLFLIIVCLIASSTNTYGQVGITFSLGNSAITNDGTNDYYEFDILAEATASSQFYIAQVYFDYNTDGFGTSINSTGNLTVTKGPLLNDVIPAAIVYTLIINDNTASKVSISNTFNGTYDFSNTLATNPIVYVHVSIKIQDPSQFSGIAFDDQIIEIELQQYYFTTPGTTEVTNYDPVTFGPGLNEPLPVELTSFTASMDKNEIELNWQTKTEVNNYGFNVERRINDGDWDSIAFIEGNGNSNSPKEYSYIDKDIFAGGSKFQYRLKQIDNNGSFEYSDVVEIEVVPTQYELSQNYPNPFNPSTTIRFSLPKQTQLKINIYNMLGELVTTIAEGMYESGYHKVTFNASNLPSGTYIYRLESSDFVQVKKMILLK
jgi:hypothetical protein